MRILRLTISNCIVYINNYSRNLNFEELIDSLKGQLDHMDFISEMERAQEEIEAYEEYYLEEQD